MGDWQNNLYWNALAYALVAGAALIALVALVLFVPALRRRWLPLWRLRPGAWTGHEVFLAFCIYVGFQQLIVLFLDQIGFFAPLIGSSPGEDAPPLEWSVFNLRCLYLGSPLILTFLAGAILTMMFARTGSRPHHYGLTWSRWPANLALGIAAFVLARPLVIAIYALALLVYPPRADPLTELGKLSLPNWEWALLAFQTTVAAPILEEILCRGILQGWLRRATLLGQVTFLFLTLFLTLAVSSSELIRDPVGPLIYAFLITAVYGYALYRMGDRFALTEEEMRIWHPLPSSPPLDVSLTASEEEARAAREAARARHEDRVHRWLDANARLAIFGSAMLFAGIHSWPGSLALFFLGLTLGWIYHRTQSLIGPIALHALFNLTTFIAFYGSVHYEFAENGNAQTTALPAVPGASAISVPASQLPLRK